MVGSRAPSLIVRGVSELTWWFSPHPAWEPGENWPAEVPVVRFETDEEVVLIDPFLPPGDDFDPTGSRCACCSRNRRTTAAPPISSSVTARPCGCRRAPSGGGVRAPVPTAQLPRGVEAIELDGEPQQVLFFIPEHATLVSGDVLSGTGGALHVFVDEADREPLLASLDALCDLPIERVIIPHGELIDENGAARIRAAVADARA